MLFNSYIFILLFLGLCIIGYFGLNHLKKYNLAMAFLLGMSLWFYGYNNINYLFILIFSVLINYGFYLLLNKTDQKIKKVLMIAGVAVNIGILLYFKYMDFFIGNINGIFKTEIPFLRIALPLGISFFTFQQISFIVDAYRGEIPKYNFLHYACFVTYFPQLIAGPIVTHDELVPQFMDLSKKKFNSENFAKGIYIFTFGLAKKVLVADTFGRMVAYGYDTFEYLNTPTALAVILGYTIQIYFDFSGYCDMAIGIGKMMNLELPVNFDSPYKAFTITEFWDRWHMTLTRFFTKYVYIPLGGSRKGTVRTYINVMLVFLISGFWHGASWTFVLWGVLHGIFNVITRIFKKFFDKLHPALNWLITFTFINVTWVFFRADNFHQALTILRKAVSFDFSGFNMEFVTKIESPELVEIMDILSVRGAYPQVILVGWFAVVLILMLGSPNAYEKMKTFKPTVLTFIITLFLLVWSVFSMEGISEFLYFNF
ncbi:MAG: MBOAT family protein [Lachnospiraceae bacterium]|nr:MBOAT family protein [Lachnospiraceae bacterium]